MNEVNALCSKAQLRTLEAALENYYQDAAIVCVGNDIELRQTDKPTAEYEFYFSINVQHTIKAESEEAARRWLEENVDFFYKPGFGSVGEVSGFDVHEIEVYEKEDFVEEG